MYGLVLLFESKYMHITLCVQFWLTIRLYLLHAYILGQLKARQY